MIIDWIKRFFVTEKKVKSPKCDICGLGAKFHMLVEFQTMELVEIENKILIKYVVNVMKKYMKDIIPKENHRQYKSGYLNRDYIQEQRRIKICKELITKGVKHYKAYEISLRRMEI